MKFAEGCARSGVEPPLAADGGLPASPPARERDPYEVLDDLMVVVEALCPRWPPRETFKAEGVWLL
ncbi:MAG: hypothetical protein IRZ28_13640 [Steroidobacteraceae bacterium]|nr:hypothetical protein [Steroidobacteraceae bacterium]